MTTRMTPLELMTKLISFPTVSRDTNLPLVDWLEEYLNGHGITCHRYYHPDQPKAALFAHVGPEVEGAVVLSGHTDVVPVDGQPWDTDPFVVTEAEGKYFGRGTCDMKGFDALAVWALVEAHHAGKAMQIALSFDDAPRKDGTVLSGVARTDILIAALAEAEVAGAAFYVMTGNIARTRAGAERLRAYAQAGHVLANHTHTHPRLRDTSPDVYLQDIDTAAKALQDFEGTLPLFRYPYLDEGDTPARRHAIRDGLAARGLPNGYVTVDTYDWYMQALLDEADSAGRQPLCRGVDGRRRILCGPGPRHAGPRADTRPAAARE